MLARNRELQTPRWGKMDSKFKFPRQITSGLEGSVELRSIERRDGVIIRAVVGLGKVKLFRRREEPSLTAERKAPTLSASGEA